MISAPSQRAEQWSARWWHEVRCNVVSLGQWDLVALRKADRADDVPLSACATS